ncbi:MAG: hypothetical protein KatS3mg111_3643 [Pirellulaceae bacterium]|nr:MAG: hypothetical protein KatS3mg111_3643 [Pirellulaceae bacterium]
MSKTKALYAKECDSLAEIHKRHRKKSKIITVNSLEHARAQRLGDEMPLWNVIFAQEWKRKRRCWAVVGFSYMCTDVEKLWEDCRQFNASIGGRGGGERFGSSLPCGGKLHLS